jgi:AraC-like DNA-binding protein
VYICSRQNDTNGKMIKKYILENISRKHIPISTLKELSAETGMSPGSLSKKLKGGYYADPSGGYSIMVVKFDKDKSKIR